MSSRVYPSLERKPGKQNWVDKTGGLPSYIERIAKHLHYEKGRTIGASIATAVETTRRWCSTGKNWNGGDLKPATRAKACKAVASWEAKKAKSKAKTAAKKLKESAEMMEARELIEAKGALPCDDTVAKELAGLVNKRLTIAEGMLPALTEPKTVGKAGLVKSAIELLEAELTDEVRLGMVGGPAADPRDMKVVADLMNEEVEELRALAESLGEAPPWEKPSPKSKKGKGRGKKLSPEAKAKAKAKAKKAGRKYPNLVDNMAAAKEMAEMKRGSSGDAVKRVQTQIEMMECYIGDAGADGKFGYHTERGVKSIQRRHSLKADGVVGPKTQALLDSKVPESLMEAKGVHPYDANRGNKVVGGETQPAAFTKKDRQWGMNDRLRKADNKNDGPTDPEFEKKHPRDENGQWIEKGASGQEVRKIQRKVGMDEPTGKFDNETVSAVKQYQQENNLQVDGIVGQQTAASMMGDEAPVGELTDKQRKWLSSDATGKKEMKEAAFVPGWESAGGRFDRTKPEEIQEADVAGSGEAEAATDGNAVDAPEGPPNLRESRGGDMRCDTCEYFEGGKCVSHGGHPVKGTQVCDEWESEMSDVMEASVARRGLRAIRSIDLPSIDLPDRKRAPRPIYRLPDGTFAPKGMGAILRPGDEVTIGGKRGKVSADGNSIEVPGETKKPVAPEARATDMLPSGEQSRVLPDGLDATAERATASWGATMASPNSGETIVKGGGGQGTAPPSSQRPSEMPDPKVGDGISLAMGSGIVEPGTITEVTKRGGREAITVRLDKAEPITLTPEGKIPQDRPVDYRITSDPNGEVVRLTKRGEGEWRETGGGSFRVHSIGERKFYLDFFASPGDVTEEQAETLAMAVGLGGQIRADGRVFTKSSYISGGVGVSLVWRSDEGDVLSDREMGRKMLGDPESAIVALGDRPEFASPGESPAEPPSRKLGTVVRVNGKVWRKEILSTDWWPGPASGWRTKGQGGFRTDEQMGAMFAADPEAAVLEGEMASPGETDYTPEQIAYGKRRAALAWLAQNEHLFGPELAGVTADEAAAREWLDANPEEAAAALNAAPDEMASPDPASMKRPLVAPERRRLRDRLIQVRNALYPMSVSDSASDIADVERRDRLRDEYVRLREVLNRDALLRGGVVMGSPDPDSESYKKAEEEISKLSFNELLEYFPRDMAATEEMMRLRLIALKANENRRDGMASPDAEDYAAAEEMVSKLSFSQLIEYFPNDWGSTEELMRYRLTALRANEIEMAEQERGLPGAGEMASPAEVPPPDELRSMNIASLAELISRDWGGKVNYAAKPYLDAMFSLDTIDSPYFAETGRNIVPYFLANARSWTGPVARAVKAELKKRLDGDTMSSPAVADALASVGAFLRRDESPISISIPTDTPTGPGRFRTVSTAPTGRGGDAGAINLIPAGGGFRAFQSVGEGTQRPDLPDGSVVVYELPIEAVTMMGGQSRKVRTGRNSRKWMFVPRGASNPDRVTVADSPDGLVSQLGGTEGLPLVMRPNALAPGQADKIAEAERLNALPVGSKVTVDGVEWTKGLGADSRIPLIALDDTDTNQQGVFSPAIRREVWRSEAGGTETSSQLADIRTGSGDTVGDSVEVEDLYNLADDLPLTIRQARAGVEGEMASPSGAGISSDPEWNSVPRLRARLLRTGGRGKAQAITERIAALEAAESSGSRLLSLKEGDRFFIPSQGLTGVVTKSPDENGFGGRADVAFEGGERLEVAIGPLTEQGAISGDTMVVPDGGEMASPGWGDRVPDYAQETIDEVRDLLVKKDGFSMELRGEYEMVANLVPGFEEMGVPGGDPNFPSQTKYSPDEMLRILAYLAKDLGDEDGTGDSGYALASDILYSLSAGEEGPWGGPWEGPEVDNALMMLPWLTPGAGQDEMASPGDSPIVLTGERRREGDRFVSADPPTGRDPMEVVTHKDTLPPGTYVIGDPLNYKPSPWQRGQAWVPMELEPRRIAVEGPPGANAWVSTAYGDGGFTDEQGRVYGVDTGIISIIGDPDAGTPEGKVWGSLNADGKPPYGWVDEPEPGEYWADGRDGEGGPYEPMPEWKPEWSEGNHATTFAGPVSVSYEAGDVVFSDGETTVRIATGDPEMASPGGGDMPGNVPELRRIRDTLADAQDALRDSGKDDERYKNLLSDVSYELGLLDGPGSDYVRNTLAQLFGGYGPDADTEENHRAMVEKAIDELDQLIQTGSIEEWPSWMASPGLRPRWMWDGSDSPEWDSETITLPTGESVDTGLPSEVKAALDGYAKQDRYANEDTIWDALAAGGLLGAGAEPELDELVARRDDLVAEQKDLERNPDDSREQEWLSLDEQIGDLNAEIKAEEDKGYLWHALQPTSFLYYRYLTGEVSHKDYAEQAPKARELGVRQANRIADRERAAAKMARGERLTGMEAEALGIAGTRAGFLATGGWMDSPSDPEMASPGVFRKPRVADAAGWALDPENEFYLPVRVERPTGLAEGSDLAPGALRAWYKVTPPGGRTRYFFGESAWSDASRYAGDQHSKLMREQDPWMASPDGPQVERTDVVKAASQLEVGDMVRLADGEYVEVIDLKPTGYDGNPLGGVAIFTEDDDLPIRASMNQRVTIQDNSFASPAPPYNFDDPTRLAQMSDAELRTLRDRGTGDETNTDRARRSALAELDRRAALRDPEDPANMSRDELIRYLGLSRVQSGGVPTEQLRQRVQRVMEVRDGYGRPVA